MSIFFEQKKREEEMTIHFLQPTVPELGSCVGRCMVAPAAEFKEVVVLCARTLKPYYTYYNHTVHRGLADTFVQKHYWKSYLDLHLYSYCKVGSIFKNSCIRSWTV